MPLLLAAWGVWILEDEFVDMNDDDDDGSQAEAAAAARKACVFLSGDNWRQNKEPQAMKGGREGRKEGRESAEENKTCLRIKTNLKFP